MSEDRVPSAAELGALGPPEAAAYWLERMQRDDAGEDDAAFRAWLGASEANRAAWDRALDVWDFFEEPAGDDLLESMRREALAFRPRRTMPVWLPYAAAASFVAIVSTAVFLKVDHPGGSVPATQLASADKPDPHRFGAPDYETKVGERRTVQLADGTKVTLDTDTAIDVAYTGDLRMVRLEHGQAFFDVAHDPAHPFRVAAGGRVVTDLGTRFDIQLAPDRMRIQLVRGSIGVSTGDDPAHLATGAMKTLQPGQQLLARAGQPDAISRFETDHAADWQQGFVQFDGVPLSAAIVELNRYTKTQLVIRDPSVAAMRISGAFRTGDAARFAETLTALYPVRIVPIGDGNLEIVRRH